jgi:hypothetical protein
MRQHNFKSIADDDVTRFYLSLRRELPLTELPRVPRTVSRDYASGCADSPFDPFDRPLSVLLQRQAE